MNSIIQILVYLNIIRRLTGQEFSNRSRFSEDMYCKLNCVDYFDKDDLVMIEKTIQCRCPVIEVETKSGKKNLTRCREPQGGCLKIHKAFQRRYLSDHAKGIILHQINEFRNLIAAGVWKGQKHNVFFPVATNMKVVKWDMELQQIAEWKSITCAVEKVCVRAKFTPRTRHWAFSAPLGERMYHDITERWFEMSINKFDRKAFGQQFNIYIAMDDVHLQMIFFHDFEKIGCASHVYNDPKDNEQRLGLDCVVGPGPPNFDYGSKNVHLYDVGGVGSEDQKFSNNSATKCPESYQRDSIYLNLCGEDRKPTEIFLADNITDVTMSPKNLNPIITKLPQYVRIGDLNISLIQKPSESYNLKTILISPETLVLKSKPKISTSATTVGNIKINQDIPKTTVKYLTRIQKPEDAVPFRIDVYPVTVTSLDSTIIHQPSFLEELSFTEPKLNQSVYDEYPKSYEIKSNINHYLIHPLTITQELSSGDLAMKGVTSNHEDNRTNTFELVQKIEQTFQNPTEVTDTPPLPAKHLSNWKMVTMPINDLRNGDTHTIYEIIPTQVPTLESKNPPNLMAERINKVTLTQSESPFNIGDSISELPLAPVQNTNPFREVLEIVPSLNSNLQSQRIITLTQSQETINMHTLKSKNPLNLIAEPINIINLTQPGSPINIGDSIFELPIATNQNNNPFREALQIVPSFNSRLQSQSIITLTQSQETINVLTVESKNPLNLMAEPINIINLTQSESPIYVGGSILELAKAPAQNTYPFTKVLQIVPSFNSRLQPQNIITLRQSQEAINVRNATKRIPTLSYPYNNGNSEVTTHYLPVILSPSVQEIVTAFNGMTQTVKLTSTHILINSGSTLNYKNNLFELLTKQKSVNSEASTENSQAESTSTKTPFIFIQTIPILKIWSRTIIYPINSTSGSLFQSNIAEQSITQIQVLTSNTFHPITIESVTKIDEKQHFTSDKIGKVFRNHLSLTDCLMGIREVTVTKIPKITVNVITKTISETATRLSVTSNLNVVTVTQAPYITVNFITKASSATKDCNCYTNLQEGSTLRFAIDQDILVRTKLFVENPRMVDIKLSRCKLCDEN